MQLIAIFKYIIPIVHAAADKAIVNNTSKVTEVQLRTFLELCWVKYVKARIEPSTFYFKLRVSLDKLNVH